MGVGADAGEIEDLPDVDVPDFRSFVGERDLAALSLGDLADLVSAWTNEHYARATERYVADDYARALSSGLPEDQARLWAYDPEGYARELVAELAGLFADTDEAAAEQISRSEAVLDAAFDCWEAFRTRDDVRAAFEEKPPVVAHAPAFAVALLKRVAAGESLRQPKEQHRPAWAATTAGSPRRSRATSRPRTSHDVPCPEHPGQVHPCRECKRETRPPTEQEMQLLRARARGPT